jgi:hypothetical protein
MKQILLMIAAVVLVGCGKEPVENAVVGEYMQKSTSKRFPDSTFKWVLLENGTALHYYIGGFEEVSEATWMKGRDGEILIKWILDEEDKSDPPHTIVFRIDSAGMTKIASIDENGFRKDLTPDTFKKIK